MVDTEAVEKAKELYDYCNHRHKINLKGYAESGEAWTCRGCPFSHQRTHIGGCILWNCDIATPYLWPVYPDKDSTKNKESNAVKVMAVDNLNPKEILLEQLQGLFSTMTIDEILGMLSNEICPPDASSHLCEDICYKDIRCIDCWQEWHKSKLNEVRQNDK